MQDISHTYGDLHRSLPCYARDISPDSDPSCHCYAAHKNSLSDSDTSDQCHATPGITPTVAPVSVTLCAMYLSGWLFRWVSCCARDISQVVTLPVSVTLHTRYLLTLTLPVSVMLRMRYVSQSQCLPRPVSRYAQDISRRLSGSFGQCQDKLEISLTGTPPGQCYATRNYSGVMLCTRYLSQVVILRISVTLRMRYPSQPPRCAWSISLRHSDSPGQCHATHEIFLSGTVTPRSVSCYARDISLRHSYSPGQRYSTRDVSLSVTIVVSVMLCTSYLSQKHWPSQSVSRYVRYNSVRHIEFTGHFHATHEISHLTVTVLPV
jgi:hypothetical protein